MPDLVPARRALMDRPQRLRFLPTAWFWNDRERQRLILPLVALIAVPVSPALFLLAGWLQLSIWLLLAVAILWPQLVLGLVERRIRAELRRRTRDGSPPHLPVPSLSGSPPGGGVFLALAGVAALGAVLAVAAAWGAAVAIVTALAPFAVGVWRLSQRVARREPHPGGAPPLSADRERSPLGAARTLTWRGSPGPRPP